MKPTPGKQSAYPDALVRGLELRVSGDGRKSWSIRYRTEDARQSRLSLGTYPALDLQAARAVALKNLAEVAQGGDPAARKRLSKHQARSRPLRTFDDLARAYMAACETGAWTPKGKKKRARTMRDDEGSYRRHVEPKLGSLRLEDITRRMIKELLRSMAARGIGAQTNRTHAFIRQAYAWAIAEFEGELVSVNPATGFAPLAPQNARTRTLTDSELRRLWAGLQRPREQACVRPDGSVHRASLGEAMSIILQLAILLLQRKSEIAGMRISELNLDEGLWLIPADRMKAGRSHLVPLPPYSISLIQKALELREHPASPFVFPARRNPEAPTRGDSVYHAMRSLCLALGIENATVHDLRRTGSTALTSERLGVMPFIRSKVLSHGSDTGGGSSVSMLHYDANEYVSEKRKALASWETLLLYIVSQEAEGSRSSAPDISGVNR